VNRRRRILLLRQHDLLLSSRPDRARVAQMNVAVATGSSWLVWCVVALLVASVGVVFTWMPQAGVNSVEPVDASVATVAPSDPMQAMPVESLAPVVIAPSRPVVVHDLHPLVLAEIDVNAGDDVLLEHVVQLAVVAGALRVADQLRHARALAVVLQLRREHVAFSRALLRSMSPELRAMVVQVLVERSATDGVPPVVAVECVLLR
jgi:hypothetical protein